MKRLFTLLLTGIIFTSFVPNLSYAATTSVAKDAGVETIIAEPSKATTDPSNQGLEAAIKAVKAKITIAAEYSEFNFYFNDASSYSDSYWTLTWTNPATDDLIQVNCDEDNHITYYYKYMNTSETSGIPTFRKTELKSVADDFIELIAPEVRFQLDYLDVTYDSIYDGNYVYSYQRKKNGVEFPDNTVTIHVNSVTGKVTQAAINWLYDVTVPSSTIKITKEEATALINKNMKMKLVYRTDHMIIYDSKTSNSNDTIKAYLAYEPTESYISIDAKTGDVYLTKSEWSNTDTGYGNSSSKDEAAAESSNSGAITLTEEEIAKIEELKTLITKKQAIAKVTDNKSLYLEKTLKSYSATLSKLTASDGSTSYVWNISLSDPKAIDYEKDTDTYRASAYASVDAKTGKLLSFYASVNNYYNEVTGKWSSVKIPYTKKEGKTILEKFLNAQIKSKFSQSVLADENNDYIAYYKGEKPVYGGYSYTYNRVNENIEYPYNSIYGSVDGVTGKIYSFGYNWDENVEFESTKGVITPEAALDYYLGKDGYELKYEINTINQISADDTINTTEAVYNESDASSVKYEIRLVYRPDILPSDISPFTGEQLDSSGEVYTAKKPFNYLDVADTKENRNILLLADMNIGFDGDYFYPEKAITLSEIETLLQNIGWGYTSEEITDESKVITREEIAASFINRLGLEKVSKLTGIYTTGYADESSIDKAYLGAVALAKGYGIMSADENNKFNPKNNVTRLEAVDLILNYINIQRKGIY
ncbi:MAG: YcdB/YcdC domain-containing protein [Mobilitalea sp.]